MEPQNLDHMLSNPLLTLPYTCMEERLQGDQLTATGGKLEELSRYSDRVWS